MEVTYKTIEHLIAKTEMTGDNLMCDFSDPEHPGVIQSSIHVSSLLGAKSRMKTSLVREIKNSLAYYVSNFLRQILGSSVGSTISRVSDQALRSNYNETSMVREDKEKAIVQAFQKVATQFYFDEGTKKFARIK